MEIKTLYYPDSKYIITIEATKYYEMTSDLDVAQGVCQMVRLFGCNHGTIVRIYDISEGRDVMMTFPASNNDSIKIRRKSDIIKNIGYCFDSFKLALSKQIINQGIKSNFTGIAVSYDMRKFTRHIECEFLNGTRNGIYNRYEVVDRNVCLDETGSYVNGKKDGDWIYFQRLRYNRSDLNRYVTYVEGIPTSIKRGHLGIELFPDKILFTVKTWSVSYKITVLKDECEASSKFSFTKDKNGSDSHELFSCSEYVIPRKILGTYKVCHVNEYGVSGSTRHKLIKKYRSVDGKLDGLVAEFFDGKKPKTIKRYVNGVLDGYAKEWHGNGVLKSIKQYANGSLNGDFKEWSFHGKPKTQTPYINGAIHGELIRWHDNGRQKCTTHYVHGVKSNEFKEWYATGILMINGYYNKGKYDGELRFYHQNGKLDLLIEYKEGLKDGICKKFYKNGICEIEGTFVKNKEHGSSKSWYPDGETRVECEVYNGLKHGKYIEKIKDENITICMNYVNGRLQGNVTIWNDNGEEITDDARYSKIKQKGFGPGLFHQKIPKKI